MDELYGKRLPMEVTCRRSCCGLIYKVKSHTVFAW